jgi:large subunit ribosomal protein L4
MNNQKKKKLRKEKLKMASKAEETKKIVKKPAAKAVKKEAPVKVSKSKIEAKNTETPKVATKKAEATVSVSKKTNEKTYETVSIDVVGIDGKSAGKISLPGEIFGEKVNKALLAQAVRVYLANQRQGNASTKTRGEVEGSTRKIYRQKGTGRARHGGVRAPIFVKGGIVFGPKPRDFGLALPQKMKRKALFVALSAKMRDNEVTVVDGLGKLEAKTKNFAGMLKSLGVAEKKQKLLFVTSGNVESVLRAGGNIQGVSFLASKQINTYEVLSAKRIIVMKDAIGEMKEHFLKK